MKKPFKPSIIAGYSVCLCTLLLVINLFTYAEPANLQILKGRIIDSADNTPIPYSSIVLYDSDSVFIAGTITNDLGAFEFGKLKMGSYKVIIKYVGYNTRTISDIALANNETIKDLGDLSISATASAIGEVTVNQRKAQVENHPDMKIVNIPAGGITHGGVVADALIQVPSVTMDANRNILLRGSTQFKVLIDGVPSPLEGNEALKGIPVANIEKIEVITNPSSAYDSEGSAGIINLLLKKEKSASLAAQVNLNASSNGSRNENISLMGQTQKLNYNLSFDDRLRKEISTAHIINTHTDTGLSDELISNYDYQLSMQTAKADATYQINPSNSIMGLFWFINANSDQTTKDQTTVANPESTSIFSGRATKVFMPQLRFTHKFKKEGSLLTLFGQYNQGSEDSRQNIQQYGQDKLMVNMDIPFKFVMAKEDLTLLVGENLTFLSGLDYKYSGFDYLYDYFQANNGNWIKDDAKSQISSFKSNISAAYLQLKGKASNMGFQAGVRAEHTDRVLTDEMDQEVYSYNKLSLFPSAQINFIPRKNSTIMISYSRRLNRPRLYQLNPFRNYSNPGYVLFGNYELVPEFQNTYEISYAQRVSTFNFNGTLYGKFTANPIIQAAFIQQDTTFFSYQNADKDQRIGTELSIGWNPTKWFSSNLTGNLYNYRLETNAASAKRENTQFETSLNLTINPTGSMSIQSFSTLKSKSITSNGYIKGYFTSDLAISQQFFAKRLMASIKVTDLLDGVEEDETITSGAVKWNRYYKPDSRQVQVSMTFNINRFTRKSTAAPEATPY
ncbi:MAG TPA: TonB-dependent receptor [Prolixibacteraceae bacterium]|nr:TonB-dependent receptor [Prolixibacteraceae bacterium]